MLEALDFDCVGLLFFVVIVGFVLRWQLLSSGDALSEDSRFDKLLIRAMVLMCAPVLWLANRSKQIKMQS
jgi:hypothetical protein